MKNIKYFLLVSLCSLFFTSFFEVLAQDSSQAELSPSAKYELGMKYLKGEGVLRNYEKALDLLEQSAYEDYVSALKLLGTIYEEGLYNTSKNEREARIWYSQAAERGDAYSMRKLAEYYDREGEKIKAYSWWNLYIPISKDTSVTLDEELMTGKQIAKAQDLSYKKIPQDLYKLADETYEKGISFSKEGVSAEEQLEVGKIFMEGQVVPRHYEKAFYFIERSARRGYVLGQMALGDVYFYWKGYLNPRKARFWYQEAGLQGHIPAIFKLGLMSYEDEDYKEAYVWLNIAVSKGHEPALELLDELEAKMSQRQINKAQKLSVTVFERIHFSN